MILYIFIFVSILIVPAIMLIAGYFMYQHPVKNINAWAGYRTKRSRKNIHTWLFAQKYCGQLWLKVGKIMILPSIIILLPFMRQSEVVFGYACMFITYGQIIILLSTIPIIENALKKNFDVNGKPRK